MGYRIPHLTIVNVELEGPQQTWASQGECETNMGACANMPSTPLHVRNKDLKQQPFLGEWM